LILLSLLHSSTSSSVDSPQIIPFSPVYLPVAFFLLLVLFKDEGGQKIAVQKCGGGRKMKDDEQLFFFSLSLIVEFLFFPLLSFVFCFFIRVLFLVSLSYFSIFDTYYYYFFFLLLSEKLILFFPLFLLLP